MTKIEWTERSWNPIVGCSLASPGCTNCYAMRMAYRLSKNPATPQYHGTAKLVNGKPVFTGKLELVEKALLEPLKRKTPTTYFVNSMGDLFHEDMPDDWIDRVFAVMALCPQHTFQVLTKRADRMREYIKSAERRVMDEVCDQAIDQVLPVALSAQPEHDDRAASFGRPVVRLYQWPLPNVWLGVSVEDQRRADERIPNLLATPAAIRFISAEPLLGAVDLKKWLADSLECSNLCGWRGAAGERSEEKCMSCHEMVTDAGEFCPHCGSQNWSDVCPDCHSTAVQYHPDTQTIDWVIVGGESGPNARPMHPDWVRSLRDQCKAAGTAFFFKQHGRWLHESQDPNGVWDWDNADERGILHCWVEERTFTFSIPLSKSDAGRLLDGVEHNEFPAS